jgi:mono/diheme cytochrome c family protein
MKIYFPAITVLAATASSLTTYPLRAQEGDVGRGAEIARTICSACHAVSTPRAMSRNAEAPPFWKLATTPGMTSIALSAALMTSHRSMPNIILEPEQRRDVIAYILSLK